MQGFGGPSIHRNSPNWLRIAKDKNDQNMHVYGPNKYFFVILTKLKTTFTAMSLGSSTTIFWNYFSHCRLTTHTYHWRQVLYWQFRLLVGSYPAIILVVNRELLQREVSRNGPLYSMDHESQIGTNVITDSWKVCLEHLCEDFTKSEI